MIGKNLRKIMYQFLKQKEEEFICCQNQIITLQRFSIETKKNRDTYE